MIDVDVRALHRSRMSLRDRFITQALHGAVSIQLRSANRKLAPQRVVRLETGWRRVEPIGPYVTSTRASIETTCPSSCPFKEGGCYPKAGAAARFIEPLDDAARGYTALDVTLTEAAAIDAAFMTGVPQDGARGGRDLRLHDAGDVSCAKGARKLAGAAVRFRARGGGQVWTYTHRWRQVPRAAWGASISVLASVESYRSAQAAFRLGYVPAIVVPEFPDGPRAFRIGKLTAIPCPFEAGAKVTCATCRLCMDDGKLRARKLAIAFVPHGPGERAAAAALGGAE